MACAVLKHPDMLNPAAIDSMPTHRGESDFWVRLLRDDVMRDCDDLEKLLIGCEIIAALDAAGMLAARVIS
ncbi:MAG: hypothetical protein DLM73_04530 [Chthoniobacterales bacterium]|nr:MAG: hypothetical protein DLM73_04530 [Chthoniobacterales bacterium]